MPEEPKALVTELQPWSGRPNVGLHVFRLKIGIAARQALERKRKILTMLMPDPDNMSRISPD
jgi:hypothetical protein